MALKRRSWQYVLPVRGPFEQLKEKQSKTNPAPFMYRHEWGWYQRWCKIRGLSSKDELRRQSA
jgi:hypothetical protein